MHVFPSVKHPFFNTSWDIIQMESCFCLIVIRIQVLLNLRNSGICQDIMMIIITVIIIIKKKAERRKEKKEEEDNCILIVCRLAYPLRQCGTLEQAGMNDPLPKLAWHVGYVVRAGDGRGVQWCKIRTRNSGPPCGLEVNYNQLLFQKDHQGSGVIKTWSRPMTGVQKHSPQNVRNLAAEPKLNRNRIYSLFIYLLKVLKLSRQNRKLSITTGSKSTLWA